MRFYLATSLTNREQAKTVIAALKAAGHEHTFDCTHAESVQVPIDILVKASMLDLKGVDDADVVVVLLPGGLGTHFEFGYALARGKRLILWAPSIDTLMQPYPVPFHWLPEVSRLIGGNPCKRIIRALDRIIVPADGPAARCGGCGRVTFDASAVGVCGMTQPDGISCPGVWGPT